MNRRDILMQQMGLTLWQLRRPEVLKGAVKIAVSENIRLIIIGESAISLQDNFIQDVLRSAEIDQAACLCIDIKQVNHLLINQSVHYWLIAQNPSQTDCHLTTLPQALSLWTSSSLIQLKQNADEKRALWKQIQNAFKSDQ